MSDEMPQVIDGFEDGETTVTANLELEPYDLEKITRTLFAVQHGCDISDVDNLLAHPDLAQHFDQIMDAIAADPLIDDCALTSDKDFIDHLESIGLVGFVPVQIGTGVGVSTHRPYHRERALAKRGQ